MRQGKESLIVAVTVELVWIASSKKERMRKIAFTIVDLEGDDSKKYVKQNIHREKHNNIAFSL